MKIKFNINETVSVVLTKFGAKVYNEYLDDCRFKYREHAVEGEELKLQLWHLMNVFGQHFHLGMEVPFKDNVIVL